MARALRPAGGEVRLALLLAVAALAACATGNKSPLASATPLEREFAAAAITWDLNKDGDVTCDEWKQYVAGLFRDADADGDGFLTRQEFAALSRSDRLFEAAGFDYFDADADGRLSLAEIADKPNPAFLLLDKNNDCVIGADERLRLREGPGSGNKGGGRRRQSQPQ
jgi:EF hand